MAFGVELVAGVPVRHARAKPDLHSASMHTVLVHGSRPQFRGAVLRSQRALAIRSLPSSRLSRELTAKIHECLTKKQSRRKAGSI